MEATKVVPGSAAGLVAFIIGWDWGMLIVWLTLMLLDIATGYAKARRNGNVKSSIMDAGLLKKFNDACAVLGLLLMQFVINGMGINLPIGPALVGAFCFKELVSILENTAEGKSGLPSGIQKWVNALGKIINGDVPKDNENGENDQ